MKSLNRHKKQLGFFDLGLSLVLLGIFGTTALIIAPDTPSEDQTQLASCKDKSKSTIQDTERCKES